MFSFHQYMQTVHSEPGAPGGNWSRSDCLSFSPALRSSFPVLSLIGPAKTSNRPAVPASILARRSLTAWTSAGGRSLMPFCGVWPSMNPNRPIALELASKYSYPAVYFLSLTCWPIRAYSGPQIQYGAVRQLSLLQEEGWSYVTAHFFFSAATSATAGVSAPVNTTSAPASKSEAAPSRSFCGSCQVLMNRTSILHSGQVTATPRAIALPRRISSGIGKVAM